VIFLLRFTLVLITEEKSGFVKSGYMYLPLFANPYIFKTIEILIMYIIKILVRGEVQKYDS